MDKQERYDELDNFISTLEVLKRELTSEDLLEEIRYLLYGTGYMNEKDELEEELSQLSELELSEREKEFRKMRGFN